MPSTWGSRRSHHEERLPSRRTTFVTHVRQLPSLSSCQIRGIVTHLYLKPGGRGGRKVVEAIAVGEAKMEERVGAGDPATTAVEAALVLSGAGRLYTSVRREREGKERELVNLSNREERGWREGRTKRCLPERSGGPRGHLGEASPSWGRLGGSHAQSTGSVQCRSL